jgi:hypothetical protein
MTSGEAEIRRKIGRFRAQSELHLVARAGLAIRSGTNSHAKLTSKRRVCRQIRTQSELKYV